MTNDQLRQIEEFCKPYYHGTGRWHAWDHITGVQRLATKITQEEFPEANLLCVQAAATIHDIGRVVKDEGHAEESGRIAEPFLMAIDIPANDRTTILDAVIHHDVKKIDQSKTLEARIVFDADKIEILSVYGFSRVWFWLVDERKMELSDALHFLHEYCENFREKLYSNYTKKFIKDDYNLVLELIRRFDNYEKAWRK